MPGNLKIPNCFGNMFGISFEIESFLVFCLKCRDSGKPLKIMDLLRGSISACYFQYVLLLNCWYLRVSNQELILHTLSFKGAHAVRRPGRFPEGYPIDLVQPSERKPEIFRSVQNLSISRSVHKFTENFRNSRLQRIPRNSEKSSDFFELLETS